MKRKYALAILTGLVCLLAQGSAWATKYFYLYNNDSNATITGLWVSPHGLRSWGGQVLSQPLEGGYHTFISWPLTQHYDWYDLRLQYQNGNIYEWTARPLNLHLATDVYISWSDGALHAYTD